MTILAVTITATDSLLCITEKKSYFEGNHMTFGSSIVTLYFLGQKCCESTEKAVWRKYSCGVEESLILYDREYVTGVHV